MNNNNIITNKLLTGRITKIFGTKYHVEADGVIYACSLLGKLEKYLGVTDYDDPLMEERLNLLGSVNTRHPFTIGDYVKIEPDKQKTGNQTEEKQAVITELLPRKNKLSRTYDTTTFQSEKKQKRHDRAELIKEQLIASNIDYVLCVNSAKNPPMKSALIDRILISAEKEGIEPVIVINKIDLDNKDKVRKKVKDIYEPIGYKIFFVSAKDEIGMDELKDFIKDKTIILTGHSGVGKSSIVNSLIGEEKLKTTETSTFHKKGKHTTTNSEMIRLKNGGHIIDTPGVKLFGIYNIDRDDIIYYYREMRPIMNDCKYSSCTHTVEDGCAILEAVEDGRIHEERYKNLYKIIERPSSKY